ncbi:MAG: DUF1285 domain-containing protein [Alphaproteobacteria bacterium]|nr:DUF1285 domain-containing protein [Alphaproteobacteria bacterium]
MSSPPRPPAPTGSAPRGADLLKGLADALPASAKGRGLPPVDKWNPDHCGAIDMRIAADGSWHYLGTPIGRPAMARLFSTILRREPDGEYVLVTPVEKVGITVEDAPFLAVLLRLEGEGADRRLVFTTNMGDETVAGPDHPLRATTDGRGEPALYVHVRGGLEARLNRPVYYQLVDLGGERVIGGRRVFGVESAGRFFELGPVEWS